MYINVINMYKTNTSQNTRRHSDKKACRRYIFDLEMNEPLFKEKVNIKLFTLGVRMPIVYGAKMAAAQYIV